MKDRDVLFHEKWLGLAQPIEGLVFSVPVLADAQIAPELRVELTTAFEAQLTADEPPRIRNLASFLREFLGYDGAGMLVPRAELPGEVSFYAAEGGQEIRPSFALARGPFTSDDPFAAFDTAPPVAVPAPSVGPAPKPWSALIWDLTEAGAVGLDDAETVTGPWRYPPTAKFERLLRHVGVPVGLLFNGTNLRLVYAPAGESTAHLTFRVEHMRGPDGRPLLAALDLLLHARRAYSASAEHTLEGLLAESRRRQADVTDELAKQVFEAVEILLAGFEAAAARDGGDDKLDWLRPALEVEGDHLYQGVLSVVLRLVFLLYAEDQALLPVEHPTYANHLSLLGLHARLSHDVGAHPESMHHRFGAYGQLLALFRAVFFGVKHGTLELPPRRGRLFDPNTYPFLEGGQPDWTAAGTDAGARAEARPPSLDDGTIYRVLHRLVVFGGQRLSYRTLDVEQIGSIYESLMGYHVLRLESSAVRIGKHGLWVETAGLRALSATDRARLLKESCGLNPGPSQSIEKALKAAGDDETALLEAVSAHAVGRRSDILRHRASAGRLVLQPGEERRRTGSHYTPRSLTDKVVRRTLEPLLACLGEERTPDQILQLKICDPAMGSGAFLVAACRELASEIVAAWTRQGELARIIEKFGDAHLHARRLVAQQCLYGVDRNAAAVELAKLSLWLVTLSRQLPFTFVDHALRHGDSLVGLNFKQIEAFHWSPPGQVETCRLLLRDALDQAVDLRQQILALADYEDPISQAQKGRLFEFSQQAIDRVRFIADLCVGAFFAETKGAAREKERNRRLALVEIWIGRERSAADRTRTEEESAADLAVASAARKELEPLAAEARDKFAPFHWWIEFPEVFFDERPDPLDANRVNGAAMMDAFVGNPPFLGAKYLAPRLGSSYRDWLYEQHEGAYGRCDMIAHFLRRMAILSGLRGAIGLVATNTLAQGDTRESGLCVILDDGWTLYDANDGMPWPGDASVTVVTLHVARGGFAATLSPRLNERMVAAIDSRLTANEERKPLAALAANSAINVNGLNAGGMGFVLTEQERDDLVRLDARNSSVLRMYIGGEDLNTSPTHTSPRHIIDFSEFDLAGLNSYPGPLAIVRDRVKPDRDRIQDSSAEVRLRARWWEFRRKPAYRLAGFKRCLVAAVYSTHWALCFQPTDRAFNNKVSVFHLESATAFAVLQGRAHELWTLRLSPTMGVANTLAYAPTECFDTFPFPRPEPRTVIPELESAGWRLYESRARFMVDTGQGLTKTYNALKDPACADPGILELRRLHEEMDRAVLTAYGWSDIIVPPYCPTSDQERDAIQAFEDKLIDRLYVLNAERSLEEQQVGLGGKRTRVVIEDADVGDATPAEAPKAKKTAARKQPAAGQGKLFSR